MRRRGGGVRLGRGRGAEVCLVFVRSSFFLSSLFFGSCNSFFCSTFGPGYLDARKV